MYDWFIIDGLSIVMATCPGIIYAFEIVLIVLLFDFLFGFIGAMKRGRLKSASMREGIYRKFAELLFVGFLFLILLVTIMSWKIINIILIVLLIKELLSLIENALILGVPIPKFIFNFLDSTSEKFDNATIEISSKGMIKLKFNDNKNKGEE